MSQVASKLQTSAKQLLKNLQFNPVSTKRVLHNKGGVHLLKRALNVFLCVQPLSFVFLRSYHLQGAAGWNCVPAYPGS